MSFYSDNGIDRAIAPALPEFGYAAEVGANNGVSGSNAKHFEDKGWIVLCVEPNPKLAPEGQAARKLWRSVACGAERREAVEFDIRGNYPYGSFSGLHTGEVPPGLQFHPAEWPSEKVQVPMERLDDLLSAAGFPRLDLLTIDVEGHELHVLQGLDLRVWTPAIIVAEAWDQAAKVSLMDYLKPFGYALTSVAGYDCVFARGL